MKKRNHQKGIITALLLASLFCVQGAEIRLNFLDQAPALEEACSLLKTNGVSPETVGAFRKLVVWQNYGGNGVNTNKFSPSVNGWYRFEGISDLSNRLSSLMPRTPGKPTLVCFDVASMLLWSAGSRAARLYDDFEKKGILEVTPERKVSPAKREQFSTGKDQIMFPSGYFQLVGKERSESETRLALSLRAARKLPEGMKDSDQEIQAEFTKYVQALKEDGFTFPKEYQLGMVLYVDVKRRFIKADHAFICTAKAGKLTTIEKASSTGPFVLGEFTTEKDLAEYASMAEWRDANDPKDCDYGVSVIVSLNEKLIGIFRPDK